MFVRLIAGALLISLSAAAETFTVDPDTSVFAVVTQRGGIAARFAHDHLIAAKGYDVDITVEEGAVTGFDFKCETEKLLADDPEAKKQWADRVSGAKLIESPFKTISEDDRATIREHMLEDDQLDAAEFPDIEAKVVSVNEDKTEFRGVQYTHTAEVEFTVHGKTVTRKIAANIAVTEQALTIEAAGAFRFTEFGIKPYSAMFGAVKNQDEFFVYCYATAARGQ